jgi:DNA-binding NarL/FixJ family response regulator
VTVTTWNLNEREQRVIVASLARPSAFGKDIASELCMSPRTVEKHWESILSKMGVNSRAEALLVWDREHRVVEPSVKAPPGWAHCM